MGALTILDLRRYRNAPVGYVIAAAILFAALALRFAVEGLVTIPFVTLFPAIIVSAFVGGRWAGIAVAATGGVVSWYLWLPPARSFALEWPTGWFNAFFYVLTSAILLYLVRRFNETLDALERERDRSAHLFSELQHRTANNLQSAAAALDFGIRRVKANPAAAIDVLEKVQRRFAVMGRIHRRLYDGEIFEYRAVFHLQTICDDVLEAMGSTHIKVAVGGDSDVTLKQNQMMTLSLLVAELLLNAIKHAFVGGRAGRILLNVTREASCCVVVYEDDGVGLSSPDERRPASGLGSRIMKGLAAQLGGAVERRENVSGYSCTVSFPLAANSGGGASPAVGIVTPQTVARDPR